MVTVSFIAVMLGAAVLQGITGFGSAVIAAPLLLLFVSKTTSVTALVMSGMALNIFLLRFIAQDGSINWRLFWVLLGTSIIGLPVGLWILRTTNVRDLQIIAGVLSIVFSALVYFRATVAMHSRVVAGIAGIVAGILQSSIGMAGPPIALLLVSRATAKNDMRKTLASYFLFINCVTIGLFIWTGTLTMTGLRFGLFGMAIVPLGAYLGNGIAKRMSRPQFMSLTFGLVLIAGFSAIYAGLFGLS